MTAQDATGYVASGDPASMAALDAFAEDFLGYRAEIGRIVAAAEADPSCALANAWAAALWMLTETRKGRARAGRYLARAEAAAATERERLAVAHARAWAAGDSVAALAACERSAEDFPRDLVAVKFGTYHALNRGDAPALLRLPARVAEANGEVAFLHGMLAFGHEQCHALGAAEASARRAMELRADEVWAHHALAHVLLTTDRADEGIETFRGLAPHWEGRNPFIVTHNWWHCCLFLLDRDRAEEALALYDRRVWALEKSWGQIQAGAVALLARLELLGVDVGDRWAALAPHLATPVQRHVEPFIDLHLVYGLARAGDPAAGEVLDGIAATAAAAHPATRAAWAEVALPAARALAAHARGDAEACVRDLSPTLPRMHEIGGSHAQRDLFDQILIDALLRSGRLAQAQRMLALRHAFNPRVPATKRLLDRVLAAAKVPRHHGG
ncbi:tetratricopeptide repeat protein [Elioraea sp.]|uniref:tetratricopeptide repeat protein n=1 Tax=Elioraea sp. TaxID=2185103 RepID=UPI0021DCD288|nr:tetratricopeptide repeat protein [Elioraea sp.]GIX10409.1 MAG: tetratricopeptide repeat protein 38 family protein [Elioraea sp.]